MTEALGFFYGIILNNCDCQRSKASMPNRRSSVLQRTKITSTIWRGCVRWN